MTMLERMARAMWEQRRKKAAEDFPTLPPLDEWGDGSVPRANGIMEEARAGLVVLRDPDMNVILRIASQTGLRPSEVDLALTRYMDAILAEASS